MAYKPNRNVSARKYLILFFIVFGLLFARYCYFGFEYFYQLDDYIQYHNYTAFSEDLSRLMKELGMLSARPLAGIFDLFLWSRFYETMLFAVAVISAMYAASAIMLHKVFAKYFGTGLFFFVIYALLPVGFEGLYWVSASSRIAVGVFFAATSLLCFDRWCGGGKRCDLVLYMVFQFVCFCFYEQIIVFSGAATIVVMLLKMKSKEKRARWGFFMFAAAALYFVVTKLAPAGVYSDRTSFFFPWQSGYGESLFLPLGNQLMEVFVSGTKGIYGKGLARGFSLLVTEPNIIWFVLVVLLCSGLFLMAWDDRRFEFKFLSQMAAGLFLAAAPMLLFFIIESPWFGLRNLATSFCGFALIGSALLDLVLGGLKKGRMLEAVVISVCALLCSIASVSELYDYRQTTIADTAISKAAYASVAGINLDYGEQVWLLNVDASYVENGNFYYHEHGYGVTSSNWAITGAVRAVGKDGAIPYLEPVSIHRPVVVESEETIEKVRAFLYKDGAFVPVSLVSRGGGVWRGETASGVAPAELRYSNGTVMLSLLP